MKDLSKKWLAEFSNTPMWNSLNDKQQESVALPNKNSLILAGAGTGKTKTLVARIAALIVDGGLKPESILALTFTNKAAKEMRERVESSLDDGDIVEKLMIGTFHSVALELITSDPEGFGFKKGISVISDFEQKALIERMFRDKGWGKDSITANKLSEMISDMSKQKRKRIDINVEFVSLVNQFKEKGLRAEQISPKKIRNFEIFRTMYREYEKYLKMENSLDFAELLLALRDRLISDEKFYSKYSGFWQSILVDEFQDTNPLQYEILNLLTKKSGAIFAVGDDDQSIYGFRGARVQNIFDFEKECDPNQVIRLEQNYRCSKNILNVANNIIKESKNRLGKELWTDSENGSLVYVHKLKDNRAEAEFIANSIDRKYKIGGVLPENIAILYRNNKASIDIEEALMKKNIPYKVVGGLSFLDKKEVKTMLAHAKCLVTLNDINMLTTATSFPKVGIGKKRLDMWRNIAIEKEIDLETVIEAFSNPKTENVPPDQKAFEFIEKIRSGRQSIKNSGLKIGLEEYLNLVKFKDSFGDKKNYLDIVKSIDAVISALGHYEADGGKSLDEFVNNLLLLDTMADEDSEAVWLSTIHAAKGLEFEHVYLLGWEDGNLPSKRVLGENEDVIDEERRLAYVAVTRAKKNLTITFKQAVVHYSEEDRDQVCYVEVMKPSRYFSDIDPKSFTLASGKEWPPTPLPVGWGKYNNHPTGDQVRNYRLDGRVSRYTVDGYELTPGSPDFVVKEEEKKRENKTPFSVNDFVSHKRFGVGRIISLSNEDDLDLAEVEVDFANVSRNFIIKYTKLQKISKPEIKKSE